MTAIARAGQSASADRGLACVADRRHEVEQREADRDLQPVVACDDDVGIVPASRPCLPVLRHETVEAHVGHITDTLRRD